MRSTMNAQRYADEVVEPHILSHLQQLESLPFQQDNRPIFPDNSVVEHVWYVMGRKLENLANTPQTLEILRHELQVTWDTIYQEDTEYLLESMLGRVG
ncbi:hypothetical protein Trydic_g15025 [Trypoxylus dichotomus]